ncbi:hypothetical protein EDC01DRAFT_655210 [Geopyxis carbonaria]|nr:hypothetical protein EDC01DRAFT_655210 [Geopyxis carbonaria]
MKIPYITIDELPKFCSLQPICLYDLTITHLGGYPIDAGIALKYSGSPSYTATPLLRVDNSIILCATTIDVSSKSDHQLGELLASASSFTMTERGQIMTFLVLRMSTAAGLGVGAKDAWSEYVKFLPTDILLPTTWSEDERKLLTGTSLEVAVMAKLSALNSEFAAFRNATEMLPWAQNAWWDDDVLTLKDWVLADAWYRSRVLQLPKLGKSMVPVLDFANHRSVKTANAFYSVDENDEGAILVQREGAVLQKDDEVTIDYSNGTKGAGEMVFSYGFIEDDRENAECMALDIQCQYDDPLRRAKEAVFKSGPILELKYEAVTQSVNWSSDFIWLIVVNEEDGLSFQVLQEKSGARSLHVYWNESEISSISKLRGYLEESRLWPVYRLRAISIAQYRVEQQLEKMNFSDLDEIKETGLVRDQPWAVACRLRYLEKALMVQALESFQTEKESLLKNETVLEFLQHMQNLDISDNVDSEPDLS